MTIASSFMLSWSLALICSALFVAACVVLGHRFGFVSNPRLFGKSERVVPNIGGVGMVLAAALVILLRNRPADAVRAIVLGASFACLLGLADDRFKLIGSSPVRRLILQIFIAALAWLTGFSADAPGLFGFIGSIVFLVAAMNAFNLLDNMDGVAGATGAATALGVGVVGLASGQMLVATLGAALSGACVGFLFFNFKDARIYLGNGGSLVVGFLVGGAALKLRLPIDQPLAMAAAIALLAVPFTDTALVILSRVGSGRSIVVGGTDHISHRLVKLGLSTQVVAMIHACSALFAAGVVLLGTFVSPWFLLLPLVLFGMCGLWLLQVPIYPEQATDRELPTTGDSI
jgi:UDP-GlcNAc:undecaprenyl-phosphate/decaprenyl-phosphate GlcNAc-1-phosphate transferase